MSGTSEIRQLQLEFVVSPIVFILLGGLTIVCSVHLGKLLLTLHVLWMACEVYLFPPVTI